ncbi:MAG: hypothetical protein ACUVS1_11415 [Actinomycetota bacterium]
MNSFLKVFVYDLKMTLRQREALFWLLLFPLLLMTILGLVFGGSGEISISVGLVDLDGSALSRAVVEAFRGIDALKLEVGEKGRGGKPSGREIGTRSSSSRFTSGRG